MQPKVARLSNLAVWQVRGRPEPGAGRAGQRSMQVQVTVQDGHVWVGTEADSVEIEPRR
jgi:uncharacterized protein YaeQ